MGPRAVSGDCLLIRSARLVPVGGRPAPAEPVDLLIRGGQVRQVGVGLAARVGETARQVLDAQGRWAIPGLWDAHTHPVMWALARRRIDLAGAADADEVLSRVRSHLAGMPSARPIVLGYGFRSATWPKPATVAALDAVTGAQPVALASGDGHNGWLNSAALALLGLPARPGVLTESQWYECYPRLEALDPDSRDPLGALAAAIDQAHAQGIVGLVDFEFGSAFRTWPERVARGLDTIRVRAATYADALDEVAGRGLKTGDRLIPDHELLTMGPLKVISDGSLNTLTAWCCQPYLGAARLEQPCGTANLEHSTLVELMTRATGLGLTSAIHAIGDAAVAGAIDAFLATGARGSIEHAQLLAWADLPRLAAAGVSASVQPAHVHDDRDVAQQWWGDRTDRLYAFAAMLAAGVPLALGSDAPVSPLDPWLTIGAAVHRGGDERPAWHPEQALTVEQALAASTDGQGTLGPGSRADLALLDADPLASFADSGEQAAYLRAMPVAATVVAGRLVYADHDVRMSVGPGPADLESGV